MAALSRRAVCRGPVQTTSPGAGPLSEPCQLLNSGGATDTHPEPTLSSALPVLMMRLAELLSVSLTSLVALRLGRQRSRRRTVSAALSAANPVRVGSRQHAELGTLADAVDDVAERFQGRVRDLEDAVLEANERAHAAAEGEARYRML